MSKVKTVLGYIVASLSIPIILATFMGIALSERIVGFGHRPDHLSLVHRR